VCDRRVAQPALAGMDKVLQTAMDQRWQASFLEVMAKAKVAAAEQKPGGGDGGATTDVRQAFVELLKRGIEEHFGGVWQCFVGKKYAFNIRANTKRGYRQEYIICTTSIGGAVHHVFSYRSPPVEHSRCADDAEDWAAIADQEQQHGDTKRPTTAGRGGVGGGGRVLEVTHTDMPARRSAQVSAMLTELLAELRSAGVGGAAAGGGGGKGVGGSIDEAVLANAVKERIQGQLGWAPTWHVVAGTHKLSGWDAAITAEPGTQFSVLARPIKIQIFRHSQPVLLPSVGHGCTCGCNGATLRGLVYVLAAACAAVLFLLNDT
jgi:hypothetical protein